MNIELHIERLILEGLDVRPGDRPRLQAAVEKELGRLLAEGGLASGLAEGGAVPALRAGDLQVPQGGGTGEMGTQIARSVYRGIGT